MWCWDLGIPGGDLLQGGALGVRLDGRTDVWATSTVGRNRNAGCPCAEDEGCNQGRLSLNGRRLESQVELWPSRFEIMVNISSDAHLLGARVEVGKVRERRLTPATRLLSK